MSRPGSRAEAPRLQRTGHRLPPVYLAGGEHDATLGEARALAAAQTTHGGTVLLSELPGAGPGR